MSFRALASASCALFTALALAPHAACQPKADFPPALDSGSLNRWLTASTSLPPSMVVSIGASSVIGLRSVTPVPTAGPRTYRAVIWAEVVSPQTAATGAYLSWTADVDVDCERRQSKAVQVMNYSERGLRGTAKPAAGVADWVKPGVGTQLYSLISAVCDPAFKRPFQTTIAQAPRAVAPAPVPAAPPVSRPPQPAPAAPPAAVVASVRPSQAGAPIPIPPPPPAAEPPPPAPPPARPAPAPSGLAAATAAPKPIALGSSRAAVQVAAGANQEQTLQTLRRIERKFAQRFAGLDGSVVKAVANGRTVYRALIHGFASRADAVALCDTLTGLGQACFVRNDFQR